MLNARLVEEHSSWVEPRLGLTTQSAPPTYSLRSPGLLALGRFSLTTSVLPVASISSSNEYPVQRSPARRTMPGSEKVNVHCAPRTVCVPPPFPLLNGLKSGST